MKLKKILWGVGLTKKTRTELSDVLYESARVIDKNHTEIDNLPFDFIANMISFGSALSGDVETNYTAYTIDFLGQPASFNIVNKGLFESFKIGDNVNLGYRQIYSVTCDYVPPNFEKKVELSKTLSGYQFVSAEKIK